jgi:alpha-2-macroglobulin
VSDPVVITPALPRFLSPGDSLIMPVTAFNTTNTAASLALEIVATGGLVVADPHPSLEVGPNQEKFVEVGLRATKQIGKATVTVRTRAFGEVIESVTELPIRPTAPYAVEAISGVVQGGGSVSHDVTDAFLLAGRRSYVTLSSYPVAGFARELKGLLGYPHGCLEQTISKAFPQIYLRDIAGQIAPMATGGGSPTYYVNEAINKLLAMQLPDGAFMYWPGEGGQASPWSTVYAAHFLTEAKRAGYAVPEGALRSAQGAVGEIARSKQTEDYYAYQGNRVSVRRIAGKAAIYGLYVLAAGGVPDRNLMEFFRAERSLLTNDTRYLLAGAYALSGDRKTFLDLLPPQFVAEEPQRTSGWSFDSPVRANALMLNVLLETDLSNPQIPVILEYLAKSYRGDAWYSTQDNAFTLLAFGKAARAAAATKGEGKVVVAGKEYAYTGGTQRVDADLFGKKVGLSLRGDGRVYYSVVTEGIRTDGRIALEDRNLQVRREFLDRNGNAVGQLGIQRNDLVVVKITVTSAVDRLENVAVNDLLPAGLEIENPRISDATHYAFIKNATLPDFLDIRDDRILFYTSFRGQGRQATFYYAVRAVSQGTFSYAPVVAEAMYDGNYRSASGGGEVRVAR